MKSGKKIMKSKDLEVCPKCNCKDIEQDDSAYICKDCGHVLSENNITSEITFVEGSDGSANVVGQFVSDTGLGLGRRIGSIPGQRQAREITLANGRRKISQLAGALKLGSQHIDAAHRFFMLALQHNFTQGRKSQNVVASCLYIVCRRFKTPHMLIDFSDVLRTSVYSLGSTFLKLCRVLNISPPLVDPSLYIYRFAAQLEFEEKEIEVVNTALRLVQRMKRDWLQTGRRPAGVCGAALLIAARIHGFRRTPQEIIQVVKICDITLRRRLVEFEKTPTSSLTPVQFVEMDLEECASECDPPAYKRIKIDEEERFKSSRNQIRIRGEPRKVRKLKSNNNVVSSQQKTENKCESNGKIHKDNFENDQHLENTEDFINCSFKPSESLKKNVKYKLNTKHYPPDLQKMENQLLRERIQDDTDEKTIEKELNNALIEGEKIGIDVLNLSQLQPLESNRNELKDPPISSVDLTKKDQIVVDATDISSNIDKISKIPDEYEEGNLTDEEFFDNLQNQEYLAKKFNLDNVPFDDIKLYLLSPDEIQTKSLIWTELNKEYLINKAERDKINQELEKVKNKRKTRNPDVKQEETPRKKERSSMINWAATTLQNLIKKKDDISI